MRGAPAKRILLLAMAAASLGWGQNAPTPSISSLSPTSVPAGSGAYTLIVFGTNLGAGSGVSFSGISLATVPDPYFAGALDVAVPAGLLRSEEHTSELQSP